MKFRFVSAAGKGFQWKLHRQSKAGFATAHNAAADLANTLGVQVKHLRKDFKGSVPAPTLPARFANRGILWHGAKLGWFTRSKRTYHLKPEGLGNDVLKKPAAAKRKKAAGGVLRLFKGVTFSKAKSAWLAQTDVSGTTKQIGGLFPTQQQAASHLAEYLGVPLSDLRKVKNSAWQRRESLLEHFRSVMSIYSALPFVKQLPGDLRDTIEFAIKDKATLSAPARALVVQVKYGPYRQVVREQFDKHRALNEWFFADCVKHFAQISEATLAPWRRNVGRHVSHHHGMLPMLINLGILVKEKIGKRSRRVQEFENS